MSMYSELYPKAERIFSYLPDKSRNLVLEYVNHLIHRQLSPGTIKNTIYNLDHFFHYLAEEKREDISQVCKQDVRSFAETLSARKLSASGINGHLKMLWGFFVYLVDEEYCDKNPVLHRYYVEQERRLPRPMSEKDLRIFVAHLNTPRDRVVFLLMLRTGLRVGEVSRIQLSDIHWPQQNLIVYNGKGKVDRVVYFSNDAEQALQLWLHTRGYISAYCFAASLNLDRQVNPIIIGQWMAKILAQCGLEGKGYTPHTLRHTFATTMLNAGMDLTVLRDLMGHKNSNMTLMYAQLSNQTIRSSYDRAVRQVEGEMALLKEGADELSEAT
jgi:integrase/recombinase XerD